MLDHDRKVRWFSDICSYLTRDASHDLVDKGIGTFVVLSKDSHYQYAISLSSILCSGFLECLLGQHIVTSKKASIVPLSLKLHILPI